MRHPKPEPQASVQLKTFDPTTFYPALAARENLKVRDDSVISFPQKSIAEPQIPRDFDPATFYPALAARDKARVVGREDSVLSDSIYPSSSISQSKPVKVEVPVVVQARDPEALTRKPTNHKRMWIIGTIVAAVLVIIVFLFAWLGTHDWFRGN